MRMEKKAKELKQGVKLENGGQTGSPPHKKTTARSPSLPHSNALQLQGEVRCTTSQMAAEHAPFQKAHTAVQFTFFHTTLSLAPLTSCWRTANTAHLTWAHHQSQGAAKERRPTIRGLSRTLKILEALAWNPNPTPPRPAWFWGSCTFNLAEKWSAINFVTWPGGKKGEPWEPKCPVKTWGIQSLSS